VRAVKAVSKSCCRIVGKRTGVKDVVAYFYDEMSETLVSVGVCIVRIALFVFDIV
jgi:hypothetical protein